MKQVPPISDAEWVIMKILWKRAPLTAQHVIKELENARDWHPKTIKTLLGRLVHKGALTFEKKGKLYQYSPAVSQEACVRMATTSFIKRVYDGALTPMIALFIEEDCLTETEIRELRRLLDKKDKTNGKRH
jgi:BlaI family penicillinase repressor